MPREYTRPRPTTTRRRRPPTVLLIRGVVYVVASDLYEERRLQPLARVFAELAELDQAGA